MKTHIEKKHPGVIISDTFQTSYLVATKEMKHLHIEVKPPPKSGGTKWKLSKSGVVDFGGKCGPKQHHRQPETMLCTSIYKICNYIGK